MGVDCHLSADAVKAWREWRRNRENACQTPCERDKLGRCKTCYAVQQPPARSGVQIKRSEIHRKSLSTEEIRDHHRTKLKPPARFAGPWYVTIGTYFFGYFE
jgi:hypothetical protein